MEINITNGIAEIPVNELKSIQKYLQKRMRSLGKSNKTFAEKIAHKAKQIELEAENEEQALEMLLDNLNTEMTIAKFVTADLSRVHGSVTFGSIGSENEASDDKESVRAHVKSITAKRENL